jgi:hypothetical protein
MCSKLLFIPVLFFMMVPFVNGQTLYIQHGKKKIKILPLAEIDVRVNGDTTAMDVKKKSKPAFTIKDISKDSIEISRPAA